MCHNYLAGGVYSVLSFSFLFLFPFPGGWEGGEGIIGLEGDFKLIRSVADHVFQVLRKLQEGQWFVLFKCVDVLLGYFVTLVFFRLGLVCVW